ncbi:hypothetical protein C8Q80DRAFT_1341272 [Daedaleopsis nitida]|nr:hypothetical protein C8Q80DRAFT_1341272 [Daedaleopsis nitida]
MVASRCEAISKDSQFPCTSYTYNHSRFCAVHTKEYRTLVEECKTAAEDEKRGGDSLGLAHEMNPRPLADLDEVDFAITMATWWVVAIDRELLGRRTLSVKFCKGREEGRTNRIAALEKTRRDGIAFVKLFKERGERLLADEKTKQTETQAKQVADAWRTGWANRRDHWERHLRSYGDLDGAEAVGRQVDEDMGKGSEEGDTYDEHDEIHRVPQLPTIHLVDNCPYFEPPPSHSTSQSLTT